MYSVLPFQIFLAFNLIAVGFNFTCVLLTHLVHWFCSQKHEKTNPVKASNQVFFPFKPLLHKCYSIYFRPVISTISKSRVRLYFSAAILLPRKHSELPCLLVYPIVLWHDILKTKHISSCFGGERGKHFASCRISDKTWKWTSLQSLEVCCLKIDKVNRFLMVK